MLFRPQKKSLLVELCK